MDKLMIGKSASIPEGSEIRYSSDRSLLPRSNIELGPMMESCGTRRIRGCAKCRIMRPFMETSRRAIFLPRPHVGGMPTFSTIDLPLRTLPFVIHVRLLR